MRRQAHGDAVAAHRTTQVAEHLIEQTRAVGDRAAIAVRAVVRFRVEELVKKVGVGAVQLYAVEPGLDRVLGLANGKQESQTSHG